MPLCRGADAEEVAPPTPPSVWDESIDTTWYDSNSTTKTATLVTAAQLAGLAELSKTNTFSGWTIKLGCDMVMNTGNASDWATTAPANTWTPISTFSGTFDGQGYTISGLYFNDTTANTIGLFKTLNGATVKNIFIKNSYFNCQYSLGSIAGTMSTAASTISNVYSDAILYANVGTKDGAYTGGIVGTNSVANSIVRECQFDGEVYGIGTGNIATRVGGIIGHCSGVNMTIKDCVVTASVEAESQAGGIVGALQGKAPNWVLENCLFLGSITTTRAGYSVFAGEFVGICFDGGTFTMKNCYGLDTYCVVHVNGNTGNDTTTYGAHSGSKPTDGSNTARFALADLAGVNARAKLTGFDFANKKIWKTVADSTPVLASLDVAESNYTRWMPSFWGYQENNDGSSLKLRFVSLMKNEALEQYNEVGYIINVYNAGGTKILSNIKLATNSVYESLLGTNLGIQETYVAAESPYNAEYFVAVSLQDVPNDVTIVVTPYAVVSNSDVILQGESATLKIANGAVVK